MFYIRRIGTCVKLNNNNIDQPEDEINSEVNKMYAGEIDICNDVLNKDLNEVYRCGIYPWVGKVQEH